MSAPQTDDALARAVTDLEALVKSTRAARERAEDASVRTAVVRAAIRAAERDVDAGTSEPVERARAEIEDLTEQGAEALASMDYKVTMYRTAGRRTSLRRLVGEAAVERMDNAVLAYEQIDRTPLEGVR